MMYGWSPQSTGIFVHLNRRWDVQTIWKCMQNRSKWHVPWMRMFCHCFPFIVFTIPKDQRGEVGTSFQIVSSASEPVIFFTNRNTKIWTAWLIPLVILVGVSSNKSKKGGTPQIHWYCMLHSWTDPSGDSCPIFHQPILGDIAAVSLQHSNLGKKKSGCSGRTNRTQWCETAEIPGHRCWTSHGFTCAVRSKDSTSHAWNSCPSMSMEFRELKLVGRFGALVWQKNVLIWFDSIPSIFTGSRACSLKGWKSLKMGRNRTQILTGADVWIWCDDMFDLRYASDALHNLSLYLIQYLQLQSKKNLIWM